MKTRYIRFFSCKQWFVKLMTSMGKQKPLFNTHVELSSSTTCIHIGRESLSAWRIESAHLDRLASALVARRRDKNQNMCWRICTPGRRQSKTISKIDERGSKIARNSVFYCHLSPVGRQMAIENSVSYDFGSTLVDSIYVFDYRLPGVIWYFNRSLNSIHIHGI